MYITRIELDTSSRETMQALAVPERFHAAIEGAFNQPGRKLWRIDKLAGKSYLLLVSEILPQLEHFVAQFGTEQGYAMRDYTPFLENIADGERRRFRLRVNPVITKSKGTGNHGQVRAHITVGHQQNWLEQRAARHGFSLHPGEFSVVQSEWVFFRKGSQRKLVSFLAVTFEGVLTITNAAQFKETLTQGIGREKAYGCGLLTVLGKVR